MLDLLITMRLYFSFSGGDTYGIHDGDDIVHIDANLYNMVVFNYRDRVHHTSGQICRVKIHFSSAPPANSTIDIMAYILSHVIDDPNTFQVVGESSLSNGRGHEEKVLTFDLKPPLKIWKDQFLALGFKSYSISPISVRDRKEYSTSMTHFENSRESKNGRNRPVVFTNYPNRGAAFSFSVDELEKSK